MANRQNIVHRNEIFYYGHTRPPPPSIFSYIFQVFTVVFWNCYKIKFDSHALGDGENSSFFHMMNDISSCSRDLLPFPGLQIALSPY